MGVLGNRRLEIFAQLLARGTPIYDAGKEAGYNTAAPSFKANIRQRVAKPEVQARVRELQERAAEKMSVDLGWIMQRLMDVAGIELNPKEVRAGDVLRAMDMIIKVRGFYAPEKREIIQRLSELSMDELTALNERLNAAEQQPDEEAIH